MPGSRQRSRLADAIAGLEKTVLQVNKMKSTNRAVLGLLLLLLARPCCAQVGPVRVQITPANQAITVSSSLQLTARFSFLGNRTSGADVTNQVTWQSSDMTIATVNGTGLVTATSKHGIVKITAARGPFRGSTTLTVIPAASLTSVTVTPANPSIPKGLKQQFTATGDFSGTTQDITVIATWSSSDTSVATIAAPGLAVGHAQGPATISATYSSVMGSTVLTVAPPALASIAITPANPSVHPGTTLQLTATGTFTDGSSQNITGSVSWSSNNTAAASVNGSGLVSALNAGSATITATGTGFMGSIITGSTNVSVPALLSIAVTPANPTIAQGSTLQLAAIGSYSDGSTMNITNVVVWSSSKPTIVPVSNAGLITGSKVGFGTISAKQGTITGSTGALIGFSALSLNGHYAFSSTGVDIDGEFLVAGSFQADGTGHLFNGVEDFNGGTGVTSNLVFSGSYVIGLDGRGTATLTTGDTLKFVLTASGNAVILQFDNFAAAWGNVSPQDPGAFQNPQGNFAFQLSGLDTSGGPIAEVGRFAADGAGHISNGQEDTNDSGAVSNGTFTGSYTSPLSSGRGTATLHNSDGTTSQFSYYIVTGNQINLVSLDFVPAFLGVAQLQNNQTFSNASVTGFYVFSENGFTTQGLYSAAGVFFANGSGTLSQGRQDINENGTVTENQTTSGTYSVAASGRGTATIDTFPYVFYMVSPSQAYFMNIDANAVLTRTIQSQPAIQFSTSSFQGNFNLLLDGENLINTNVLAMSGQMFADGAGTLTGNEDVNDGGILSANVPLNGTYSVDVDGRGTGSINGPNGTLTLHFYMVSFDSAVFVETDSNNDQIGSAMVQF